MRGSGQETENDDIEFCEAAMVVALVALVALVAKEEEEEEEREKKEEEADCVQQEFDCERVKQCVVFELRQTIKIPTAAATMFGSPKAGSSRLIHA